MFTQRQIHEINCAVRALSGVLLAFAAGVCLAAAIFFSL